MFSKQVIIDYITARHLSDGGYFFARIEPSSQLETYLAIKTLISLNYHRLPKQSLITFWNNEEKSEEIDSISSLYLMIKSFILLDLSIDRFKQYKPLVLSTLHNPALIKHKSNVYTDGKKVDLNESLISTLSLDLADNEFKDIYRLVAIIKELHLKTDMTQLISYIHSFQNEDGGYGHIRGSHLPTTFYVLKTLKLLHVPVKNAAKLGIYLQNEFLKSNYLEGYFWSVTALAQLKKPVPDIDLVLTFITRCHKGNGGFARSQFMGIANIEQTYQAVSLLKFLKAI